MKFILRPQPKKKFQRAFLVTAFFLCFISFGYSQATFNSAASGNWGDAGTWAIASGTDGDGIPDANDVVNILNTHIVAVSDGAAAPSTHACSSITINSGGTLRTNSGTFARTLLVGGNFTIASGGTYTVNDAGLTISHFLSVGGNFTNNGGTFTPLIANTSLQVTFNGTAGQLINGTVASQTFNSVIVNKTSGTLSTGGSTTSLTVSAFTLTLGNFTGPTTFTSTGTVTLSAGVFTAGTNTNVGGDFINNGGAFTPGVGIITFNGTGAQSIAGSATTQSFANFVINKTAGTLLSVGGSTTQINVSNFTQTLGNFTAPATVASTGGITLTAGTYTAGSDLNVAGNFTNNGGTFTAGSGTVTLNGTTQTLGGTTSTTFNNLTINNGAVTLGRNTTSNGTLSVVIPGSLALSTFNFNSNGLLSLNGSTISGSGTLTLAGNITTNASATSSVISAPVSMSSTQTLTINNGASSPDLSVTSIISGASGLVKSGTGELSLSGANSFTGGVSLTNGTLDINNSSALGTIAGTFTINGGTINNTSAGAITTLNYPQAWNADFTFTGTQNLNFGTGAVTPNSNRIVAVTGGTLTVNGVIGGGAVSITKEGAGTLIIGGSNTFTGGAIINAGVLRLGNAGALNSTTPNAVSFGS
ncbi:MAG: hypothetical protein HOP30_21400, partial [Cyclobacteriaceae bacterium]|nr:hypothetical protein [Cyclobacteriaceae bacterium]